MNEYQLIMPKLATVNQIQDPVGWIKYITKTTLGQENIGDAWSDLILPTLDGYMESDFLNHNYPKMVGE